MLRHLRSVLVSSMSRIFLTLHHVLKHLNLNIKGQDCVCFQRAFGGRTAASLAAQQIENVVFSFR